MNIASLRINDTTLPVANNLNTNASQATVQRCHLTFATLTFAIKVDHYSGEYKNTFKHIQSNIYVNMLHVCQTIAVDRMPHCHTGAKTPKIIKYKCRRQKAKNQ